MRRILLFVVLNSLLIATVGRRKFRSEDDEDDELTVSQVGPKWQTLQHPLDNHSDHHHHHHGHHGTSDHGNSRVANAFINSGVRAVRGSHPWLVTVQAFRDGMWGHVCVGTLIKEDRVITAAHCVKNLESRKCRVGAAWYDLYNDEGREDSQTIHVIHIAVHPNFNLTADDADQHGDLAMLTLEEPAVLGPAVQPLALMENKDDDLVGSICKIAGWGYSALSHGKPTASRHLLEGTLTVISRQLCRKHWKIIHERPRVYSGNICGLDYPTLQSGCEGDGGTPLVCAGKLTGVLSWGIAHCNGCVPNVFARITTFLSWIYSVLPKPEPEK